MIVVAGTFIVSPDHHETVAGAARQVAEATRAEAGCITYEFWAGLDDRGRFLLFEEWESEPELDAHMERGHYLEFRALLADLEATRSINRYTVEDVRPNQPSGR